MVTRASPLQYRRLSLSVAYRKVLFPFDVFPFARALQNQSYIINEAFDAIPLPTTITITGPLARRGDIAIAIDPDKQTITVLAQDTKTVTEELSAVEDILQRELGFNSKEHAFYYEVTTSVTTTGRESPLTAFPRIFENSDVVQSMAEILGSDTGVFGVRLARNGQVPNQPEWFDIRLEPNIAAATSRYLVEVVYRSAERDAVFDFTKSLTETVRELIAIVERRPDS